MKQKKVFTLGLLMAFSQLILTVFVIWWITRQYGNEKELLVEELERKFAETEQQVSDSVIFKNFIEPLTLRGTKDFTGPFSIDKMPVKDTVIRVPDTFKQKQTVISFSFNDTVNGANQITTTRTNNKNVFISSDRQMVREMVMGMKLFIKGMPGDSAQIEGEYRLSVEADSSLFKKLFVVKTNALGLNTAWIKRNDKKDDQKPKEIYLYSTQFKKLPGVVISGHYKYLFLMIWPQLAFGLLLVVLTATSFMIAYRSLRTQQRLHAIREDFISNISHELKTPLSTAKVTIEALKTFDAKKRNEVMEEYLDIADAELGRLDELVTKVLRGGMLENENGFIRPEPTEINTLIGGVVTAFSLKAKEKNAEIAVEPHEPLTLMIDPLHIHGALNNLLDNALKYYQGDKPYIRISIAHENGFVLVKVTDNGPGIHADYTDRVFDKFFRVPSGNVHNVKGHGLGLNYTQTVMKKHGGKVTVHNNAGGGCTFTLYFPAEDKV